MSASRRPKAWLWFGVAVTVGCLLAAAGIIRFVQMDKDDSPAAQDIGANVAVIGNDLPDGLKATESSNETPLPASEGDVTSLGAVVDITPHGPLPAEATLRFTLDQPVSPDDIVFVATRRTPGEDWQYLEATISEDGTYALVKTNHLSSWWPFKVDFGGLFEKAKREIVDALTGGLTSQAQHPTCKNEDAARQDGYQISHEGQGTLYWCFGIEDGQRTLKVTNRMRYPIEVEHPGFDVVSAGAIQLEFQHLARLGSGENTVLFPHDTAVYTMDLAEEEGARVDTQYSGWAQSLHRFDIALQTLVVIMGKLGASELKDPHKYWEAMNRLLSGSGCYNAVADGNIGRAITNCFSIDNLKEMFGLKGVLLAPFIATGSLLNWLVSEFSSLRDIVTGKDEYSVLVTRQANPLNSFVGTWRVHGGTVVINADGTGTEQWNMGPCNYGHMCTAYTALTFDADGDALVATYVGMEILDDEGNPPFDSGTALERVGQSYTMRHVENGLLERTMHNPQFAFGNKYLCGEEASAEAKRTCNV